MVPAVGSGSGGSGGSGTGAGTGAGLERRKKKKKIWTGYVEDSRGESAIALRYRRRLVGGASNPNVTKTTYHMRTLDEQASDS